MFELVGDHERHFGGTRLDAFHPGHSHDPVVKGDEGVPVDRIDGAEVLGLTRTKMRVNTEEPPVDGLEPQPLMELDQRAHVTGFYRSHLDRRATRQRHHCRGEWSGCDNHGSGASR